MILTLTLNPAVDQTMWVDRFVPGDINRPREVHLDPAGKGINVSRMVHRLGCPTIALGFVAGDIGQIVEKALDAERVHNHFVALPGQTRINVTIMDDAGSATSLYGPGPDVTPERLAELEELLKVWLEASRVLVLAGSVPPGVDKGIYARYVELAHARGALVVLDADKQALARGLIARPDVIKPNVEEATRLLGRPLPDEAAVLDGARELAARGIRSVLISMGAKGAVCVHEGRASRIVPPVVKRLSTVGSGDSLVAGVAIALSQGRDFREGLRLGTAAGAATAMSAGTALGTKEDVLRLMSEVRIEELGG